eukprot:5582658-Amphidinium_carterae.1
MHQCYTPKASSTNNIKARVRHDWRRVVCVLIRNFGTLHKQARQSKCAGMSPACLKDYSCKAMGLTHQPKYGSNSLTSHRRHRACSAMALAAVNN